MNREQFCEQFCEQFSCYFGFVIPFCYPAVLCGLLLETNKKLNRYEATNLVDCPATHFRFRLMAFGADNPLVGSKMMPY